MPTGINTAYDLTTGVKINMDEAIYLLSPIDAPMLTGVDTDGLSVLSSAPVDEIEFKWMDEEILTPRSAVVGTFVTATTALTVTAGDQTKFSTGDVLRITGSGGSEILRVTEYSQTTADTLTVTRGYDGTTAQSYTAGDAVIGLGTALAEGSDPENNRSADRTEKTNFTQIFGPTSVLMSRTEQGVNKYGVANEFTHQIMRRTQENVISREQAFIYGRKSNSTTTKIRTTGGLDFHITTNDDSTNTQVTVAHIETNQQLCYNLGGLPQLLAANPASLGDLNSTTDTSRVRQDAVDTVRGRRAVMSVWTEFGAVTIVRNRWIDPAHVFAYSRENVTRRVFDPLTMERLAKTGDSDKVQIVCEEGLQVKGEQHMFKMSNLSY